MLFDAKTTTIDRKTLVRLVRLRAALLFGEVRRKSPSNSLGKKIIIKDISARRAEFTERGVRKDPTFCVLTPRVLRGLLTSIFFFVLFVIFIFTRAPKK